MLFDLRSGKRRRMVQVVYSLLAVSFLIGFVIFGVGTGGLGSISDIFSGGSSGSTSSAYDSQISNAEAKLKKDPKDPGALQQLAYYSTLASGITQSNPSLPSTIDTDAQNDLAKAFDAWTKYVKVAPKPDVTTASNIAFGYAATNDFTGAVRAQRVVAKSQPSSNSLGQLALYLYGAGSFKAGDRVAKQAVAKAPKSIRSSVKKSLAQRRKLFKQFAKQQKAAAKASQAGGSALSNPFGGTAPGTAPSGP